MLFSCVELKSDEAAALVGVSCVVDDDPVSPLLDRATCNARSTHTSTGIATRVFEVWDTCQQEFLAGK